MPDGCLLAQAIQQFRHPWTGPPFVPNPPIRGARELAFCRAREIVDIDIQISDDQDCIRYG
ncbi:MAG: hypothetical protein DWH91_18745 [Planctomycetota bacterium]|nr:MAG: hypothetical protein DWH91_18745 [Planctomycetota bacterium]